VRRALAKDPSERFASAEELGRALVVARDAAPAVGVHPVGPPRVAPHPAGPPPVAPPPVTSPPATRRRTGLVVALVALALLVLGGTVAAVLLISSGDDDPKEESAADGKTLPRRGGPPTVILQQLTLDPLAAGRSDAGLAVISERGGKRELIVQAKLTPLGEDEAYEVWLYNDSEDARSMGAQVTDPEGNYQGAAPLPGDLERYEYIDISREPLNNDQAHSGKSVLRGKIADFAKSE
jgi:hypothetical protein